MLLSTGLLALLTPLAPLQNKDLQVTTPYSPVSGNGFVVVSTDEDYDDIDLNGDGQLGEHLVRLSKPDGTDVTFLPGLGTRATADGDWFAYYGTESADGTDVNGDGDDDDLFPVIHHVPTGTTRVLPYAMVTLPLSPQTSTLAVGDGLWAFRVREGFQGQDLNGDGDLLDSIQYVHHAHRNTTYATGIASTGQHVGLGWAVFSADESAQGEDLNGDGDQLDRVLHALRGSDGTVVNLGLAGSIDAITYPLTPIFVNEAQQGDTDLNGDGDAADNVLHVLDLSTGELTNTQATVYVEVESATSSGQGVAFRSFEFSEGSDLNGDGDLLDFTLQVWNGRKKEVVNLGVSGGFLPLFQRPAIDYPIVAANVSENAQGMDLSGDGDMDDQVLITYDISTGVLTNTEITSYGRTYVNSGYVFAAVQPTLFTGSAARYDAFTGDLLPLGSDANFAKLEFSGGSAYFVGTAPVGFPSFWKHELESSTTTNLGGQPVLADVWDLGETALYYLRNAPSPPFYSAFSLTLP